MIATKYGYDIIQYWGIYAGTRRQNYIYFDNSLEAGGCRSQPTASSAPKTCLGIGYYKLIIIILVAIKETGNPNNGLYMTHVTFFSPLAGRSYYAVIT